MKRANKTKVEEQRAARRLRLRKELLRNLDVTDLAAIAGGIEPQCMMTRGGTTQ